jgi:hypothetical protein
MADYSSKDKLQIHKTQLIHVFSKYFIKLMNFKRNSSESTKDFQSSLLKIPNWSDERKEKEYNNFLKYVSKKYQLDHYRLLKTFNQIFILYAKILLYLFQHSSTKDFQINVPDLSAFWYKCLKYVAKYFYEHPKMTHTNVIENHLHHIIELLLQKYIPISQIINETEQPETTTIHLYDEHDGEHDGEHDVEHVEHVEHDGEHDVQERKESIRTFTVNKLPDTYLDHEEIPRSVTPRNYQQNKLYYLVDLENEFYCSPDEKTIEKKVRSSDHTEISTHSEEKLIIFTH